VTPQSAPTLTHAETAWLETSVPLFLTVGTLLLLALVLRGRLRVALTMLLLRRSVARQQALIDPALVWLPQIARETQLLGISLASTIGLILALSPVAPLFVVIILSGPAVALLIWLLLWVLERQYVSRLDSALTAAVGRLEAQMRAGSGLQTALQRVLIDMPNGPLRDEWLFLVTKLGTPLGTGTLATPQHVVRALLYQTASKRHATLLGHLEMALEQPHSAMVQRVRAAYAALQTAEQRRSAANTELSQMRYSGIAISLAGLTMALYLIITQQARFAVAYQGFVGTLVGAVVVTALLAPLVGGYLLSQANDLDY
jgi:hypothetical protein